MVILKRRIADVFRKRKSHPVLFSIAEVAPEVPDTKTQVSGRSMILSNMLQVTLRVLDEMPPEDRDLVAFVSKNIGFRQGLNARDRQRLHRIRKKLRDEIARHLGVEATELLRITD
jgi:DNA-directed RNA polymerase specialized sigma24 family protein